MAFRLSCGKQVGEDTTFCSHCETFKGERYRKWLQKETTPNAKTRNGLVTASR